MGNFSRNPDDELNNAVDKKYVGVRIEQNLPLLERDLNLATDLLGAILRGLIQEYIGDGTGIGNDGAFAITPASLGSAPAAQALTVLLVVRVLYDSSRHALAKPAREVLFTHLDREQRYKSKAFIDAAVYRGGDLLSGWIYAALAALGMSVGAIALAAAPVAVFWALLGRSLRWGDHGTSRPE